MIACTIRFSNGDTSSMQLEEWPESITDIPGDASAFATAEEIVVNEYRGGKLIRTEVLKSRNG